MALRAISGSAAYTRFVGYASHLSENVSGRVRTGLGGAPGGGSSFRGWTITEMGFLARCSQRPALQGED